MEATLDLRLDPLDRLNAGKREFGEFGGVNASVEISTTFTGARCAERKPATIWLLNVSFCAFALCQQCWTQTRSRPYLQEHPIKVRWRLRNVVGCPSKFRACLAGQLHCCKLATCEHLHTQHDLQVLR